MVSRFADLFTIDLRALSLFRIGFGVFLLAHLFFFILPVFDEFYTNGPTSLFTQEMSKSERPFLANVSLLYLSNDPVVLKAFLIVYFFSLLAFILGYKTHVVKFIVFILYYSFYYRANIINTGAESLARLLLAWSLLVPLNRYWSIDSALCRADRNEPVNAILTAPLKLQVVFVYLFAGIYKAISEPWWNGMQIISVLNDRVHGSPLGKIVSEAIPQFLIWSNYGIIIFQLVFIFLVFSPFFVNITRAIAIAGGFLSHLSFIFLMRVSFFPYICILHLVFLVPSHWWNAIFAKRWARLEKIEIYYEPGCAFCEKTGLILREFLLSPYSRVLPADTDPVIFKTLKENKSWVVVDHLTGKTYLKWEAVAFVMRRAPLTWIFGVLTDAGFVKAMMAHFYDFIGRQRSWLGKITRVLFPFQKDHGKPLPGVKILCLCLIGLMIIYNTIGVIRYPALHIMSMPWRSFYGVTQITQQWSLFVPQSVNYIYDYRLMGWTKSGKVVDLTDFFSPDIKMDQQRFISFTPPSWQKYFFRIFADIKGDYQKRLAYVICNNYYPRKFGTQDPLSGLEISYYRQEYQLYDPNKDVPLFNRAEYPCKSTYTVTKKDPSYLE